MKIVSLVPSITESLFDFGLDGHEIIGRTKFCIHPEEKIKNVPIIGGTKNVNIEKIHDLKPDLIIANKEENVKKQVEVLQEKFDVWVTDIATLEDNSNFLTELGKMFGKEEIAEFYNQKIKGIFDSIHQISNKKAAYLIWKNPYMTVGSDTFIHEILHKMGINNIFENKKRYPEIAVEDMGETDFIFLSSEPFPFKEKHISELQKNLPNAKIILVDGEAFSWYGTHLAKCGAYYKNLLQSLH